MRALALVCTLKPSRARSSSQLPAGQVLRALGEHHVTGEVVRVADHDVRPGVETDAVTYRVGEAMHATDYQDLDRTPQSVTTATATLATNTAHLARVLRGAPCPPSS